MAINMYYYIALFVALSVFVHNSSSLRTRMKPVIGETYFASEQLLESKIEGIDKFKDAFTFPEDGLFVSGTFEKISQQIAEGIASGRIFESLVMTVIELQNYTVQRTTYEEIHLNSLKQFSQDLKDFNLTGIKEFWLIIKSLNVNYIYFNIDFTKVFSSLTHFHLVSHFPNHHFYLPETRTGIFSKLIMLDLQNTSPLILKKENFSVGIDEFRQVTPSQVYLVSDYCFNQSSSLEILSFRSIAAAELVFAYTNEGSNAMLSRIQNLEYLAICSNKLANSLPTGLNIRLPKLRVLDVSHNMEGVLDNSPLDRSYVFFVLENVLFHPSLQLFISSNEMSDYLLPSQMTQYVYTSPRYNQIDIGDEQGLMALYQWYKSPGNCLREKDIAIIFSNLSVQCEYLKCIFLLEGLDCSHSYIRWESKCTEPICLPVARMLEEVYITNILYRNFGAGLVAALAYNILAQDSKKIEEYHRNQGNEFECDLCFNNNSLKKISMAFNHLTLFFRIFISNMKAVEDEIPTINRISGLNSLEEIVLNYIEIDQIFIFDIFTKARLPGLRYVYLRGNNIFIPNELQLCKKLRNLTEIDLAENRITKLPSKFLDQCLNLKFIDLSKNLITTIPSEIHKMLGKLDIEIDLSDNPLSCECHDDAIETLTWLQKHHFKYKGFDKYMCYGSISGKLIIRIDLEKHSDDCEPWMLKDIIILCVSSVLCTLIVVALIISGYKYRYRLIMNLYSIKRFFRVYCGKAAPRMVFTYDLYVSYCNEDRHWVHGILRPVLEDLHGIRCCIHYRDFPVDGTLSKVIHQYMDNSRYILVIMSQYSINKRWPAFEFEYARDLQRREGKKVFFVKLDNLGENINEDVQEVLDSEIYLECPEDFTNMKLFQNFFHKLVAGIRGEELCESCCTCCYSKHASRNMPFDNENVELINRPYMQHYSL